MQSCHDLEERFGRDDTAKKVRPGERSCQQYPTRYTEGAGPVAGARGPIANQRTTVRRVGGDVEAVDLFHAGRAQAAGNREPGFTEADEPYGWLGHP